MLCKERKKEEECVRGDNYEWNKYALDEVVYKITLQSNKKIRIWPAKMTQFQDTETS